MKKIVFMLLFCMRVPVVLLSQDQGASVRTSFVFQRWDIENYDDAISEGTLPIEVVYPLRENVMLQINHSPALSTFGDINMSGLSDTWVRSTFSFAGDNAMASFGIGLPTGKTSLSTNELFLLRWLSEQSFKFQLPIYGQGLTVSGGVMYAYPVNESLTIGSGLNYVYRGKYKLADAMTEKMDPGDQIGINLGFDYAINAEMTTNLDAVYMYYLADDLGNNAKYKSGPSLILKVGFWYKIDFGTFWLNGLLHTKAKNELDLLNIQSLKSSNRTLREVTLGYKFDLTDQFVMSVVGEGRSYVESNDDPNWVDLFGGGFVGEYSLSSSLKILSGLKLFFGDRYLSNIDPNETTPKLQGLELHLGSQWNF